MGKLTTKKLAIFCTSGLILSALCTFGKEDESGFNLADAFAQPKQEQVAIVAAEPEVEPIVSAGRNGVINLLRNLSSQQAIIKYLQNRIQLQFQNLTLWKLSRIRLTVLI